MLLIIQIHSAPQYFLLRKLFRWYLHSYRFSHTRGTNSRQSNKGGGRRAETFFQKKHLLIFYIRSPGHSLIILCIILSNKTNTFFVPLLVLCLSPYRYLFLWSPVHLEMAARVCTGRKRLYLLQQGRHREKSTECEFPSKKRKLCGFLSTS